MNPRRRIAHPAIAVIAGAMLLAAPAAAEDAIGGDMVVTKDMKPWEGCGECHDLDGVAPNGHFPNLAAQKPDYLTKQMEDFKKGGRDNDHGQMGTSSRELTPKTRAEVVSYFSALPPPAPVKPADIAPDALARARRIVERGSKPERIAPCINCHGPHPKRAFFAPWLEAQQPAYLVKELQDFKAHRRRNDPDGVMQKIAQTLSEADIEALAAYLAGEPRHAAAEGRIAATQGGKP